MQVKTLLGATAIAVLVVAGCSSDDSSSSGTTTTTSPKAAVCDARAALKTSVTALVDPAVLTGGKTSIEDAVATVKSDLDAFESAAGDLYQPEIDDVKSAVDDVQSSASDLGSGGVGEGLAAVGTAIAGVGTSMATLAATADEDCPSS